MNVNYHISPYPSLLEDMVAKIYEVNPDGTKSDLAMDIVLPAPHNTPQSISFNGLDKVTHEVRLYTDPSANLLHQYQVQPTTDTTNVYDYIRFEIGDGGANTPTAGSDDYTNPDMIGLQPADYVAIRSGQPQFEGTNIINDAVNGGFSLAIPGDVFSGDPAEQWVILRKPQVITMPVNDSVVGKQFGATALGPNMYLDVSSAVTYTAAHLRHLIRLAGPSAVYTFGALEVPPVGYVFRITNFGAGGTTTLPEVHFDNAPLLYGGTTKNVLQLPLLSTIEVVFDGTNWNASIMDDKVINPAVSVVPTLLWLGVVNNPNTFTKRAGSALVTSVVRTGVGLYTINHNIGNTSYWATGIGAEAVGFNTVKCVHSYTSTSFQVRCSDDSTANDTNFQLEIKGF